jgi:hypothetical protein
VPPAFNAGPGYATYVVWIITRDGHAANVGELPWRGSPKLRTSVPVQRFALMVTAEPYGAVARPSPKIVAENKVKDDDSIETIGGVTYQGDDGRLYSNAGPETDARTPVPVAAARFSVQIARRTVATRLRRVSSRRPT